MALQNTLLQLSIPQMPSFLKAIGETPNVQLRYMRSELNRGVKRIRKNFIKAQLHGPPGIKATGKLSKGKNVRTHVEGKSLGTLGAEIAISRILHVHEKGLTILPKKGAFLFLHEPGGRKKPIFGVARQVVIPSRLKFRQQVAQETPAMLRKVGDAGVRATQATLTKGLLKHA